MIVLTLFQNKGLDMGKSESGLNFYDAMKQGRTKITPEQERQNEEERRIRKAEEDLKKFSF